MKQCRAVRWDKKHKLYIDSYQITDPGEDEVRVAVGSAGVCGSDLHYYNGQSDAKTGIIPGHEIGGTVEAVGKNVAHVREGDVVGIEPLLRCGECRYCKTGNYHMCIKRRFMGDHLGGGMTEFVNVPGHLVFPAPGGVDAEVAALAEPLACTVHGFEKARIEKGETVLILGAGTLGLLSLSAIKTMGAHGMIVARYPHQQEAARRLGAKEVIADDEAGHARLKELAEKEAVDVAIELVGGNADTIIQAQRVVRTLGRVVVLGVFTVPTANIDPQRNMIKEIHMMGAVFYGAPNGRAEFGMALDILADTAESARTIITHRFDLDSANEAFQTAADKSSGSIKVHINPGA